MTITKSAQPQYLLTNDGTCAFRISKCPHGTCAFRISKCPHHTIFRLKAPSTYVSGLNLEMYTCQRLNLETYTCFWVLDLYHTIRGGT